VSGDVWRRFTTRRSAMIGFSVVAAIALLSLLAPLVAPQDPTDPLGFDPLAANHPPNLSWTYLLGADARGRSVLALLLWGGRTTLSIGVGAALLAALLGVALGALACWRGRLLDPPLSWAMDVCGAAPPLLALLLLAGRLGGVPVPLMLAVFAFGGWVAPARLTRAAVRGALAAPYVEAARAAGVGGVRLLLVHLLPAALAPVAAWTAASAATYVALEAGLDFLGLGLPAGTPSWGSALAGAQEAVAAGNWWWITFGGAALALSTRSLAAVARGVARALDPVAPVPLARLRLRVVGATPGRDEPTPLAGFVPADDAAAPSLPDVWGARREERSRMVARTSEAARRARRGAAAGGVALLLLVTLGLSARVREMRPGPAPVSLLRGAAKYAT